MTVDNEMTFGEPSCCPKKAHGDRPLRRLARHDCAALGYERSEKRNEHVPKFGRYVRRNEWQLTMAL